MSEIRIPISDVIFNGPKSVISYVLSRVYKIYDYKFIGYQVGCNMILDSEYKIRVSNPPEITSEYISLLGLEDESSAVLEFDDQSPNEINLKYELIQKEFSKLYEPFLPTIDELSAIRDWTPYKSKIVVAFRHNKNNVIEYLIADTCPLCDETISAVNSSSIRMQFRNDKWEVTGSGCPVKCSNYLRPEELNKSDILKYLLNDMKIYAGI